MLSSSPSRLVERARPLLGTTVNIRVASESEAVAHDAITQAFAAVERVHALMSFHEAASDLSRLHAAAPGAWVEVDAQTAGVLSEAQRLSQLTQGVFDVTVGGRLVARRLLPAPPHARLPEPDADWQHIEIDGVRVRLHRALWIDLGGIAKGYAVDCAVEALRARGITHACVNAGGDLGTLGDGPHTVVIATDEASVSHVPVLEVGEVAVATSTGRAFAAPGSGPHIDARRQIDTGLNEVATVVAKRCIHADALTKVVLAMGAQSHDVLQHFEAMAYLQDATGQWTGIGKPYD